MGTVNIKVMFDTNINSARSDAQFHNFRRQADNQTKKNLAALSEEMHDYLDEAARSGSPTRFVVTQHDTAQIFHEKTNMMTPELAKRSGRVLKPDFLRNNLKDGHYFVEPPIHGEDAYCDALESFLQKILPEKDPEGLKVLNDAAPKDRVFALQEAYYEHMTALPATYRTGKYKKAFKEYREVRFNAGEVTAIEYLKNHPLPPEGERTAFLFVGKDRWANQEMNKTREGIDGEGRFEAFGVHPKTFNKLMGEIIREVERTQPHMRKARQSYALLSQIDVEEPQTPTLPKSGRNFVSFVTRVLDETPAQERER